MKSRDEVVALFRDKYAYLQMVCQQQIGPFNESAIYQNPDGGWQLNLEQPGTAYRAAITLRPNDEAPHETHGVIGARWFQEGGAFDVNGIPGRLGYPVSDEEKVGVVSLRLPSSLGREPITQLWKSQDIEVSRVCSKFEFGRIEWREGITWDRAAENLNYDVFRAELSIYESSSNHWYWSGPLFDSNCPEPPQPLGYLMNVEPLTGGDLQTFFQNYANAHHVDYDYYSSDHYGFAIPPSLSVTFT